MLGPGVERKEIAVAAIAFVCGARVPSGRVDNGAVLLHGGFIRKIFTAPLAGPSFGHLGIQVEVGGPARM